MGYTPIVCGRDDSPLSTLVHITYVLYRVFSGGGGGGKFKGRQPHGYPEKTYSQIRIASIAAKMSPWPWLASFMD